MIRQEVFVSEDDNRDHGKLYLLTEMDAAKAEKWAARALNALASSGIEVNDGAGLMQVASIGLSRFKGLPWEQIEPLLDEMFECVSFIPDPAKKSAMFPFGYPRPLAKGDIEEVVTRLKIRAKLFELHLGFSLADVLSRFKTKDTVGEPPTSTPTSQA